MPWGCTFFWDLDSWGLFTCISLSRSPPNSIIFSSFPSSWLILPPLHFLSITSVHFIMTFIQKHTSNRSQVAVLLLSLPLVHLKSSRPFLFSLNLFLNPSLFFSFAGSPSPQVISCVEVKTREPGEMSRFTSNLAVGGRIGTHTRTDTSQPGNEERQLSAVFHLFFDLPIWQHP